MGLGSLLYLTEGDAESLKSWSGSSNRLVGALRRQGLEVATGDVLPGRLGKWLSMAATFRPSRASWAARYHLGDFGFMLRSRRAAALALRQPGDAPVLQSGATFDIGERNGRPWYLYCDANAMLAERGRPWSMDSALPPALLRDVLDRERRTYQSCDGIFTMSEMARRSFIDDFAVAPAKVTTVYAGPNLEVIPAEADLVAPRQGPPTIAFVGKQFLRKGGDDVVAAFRIVRSRIPDARLVIAGSQPSIEGGTGIEIRGWLNPKGTGPGTLSALYREADLFCLPSRYEPFGIVFVEAMLHALPCVGARAWAMPELVDEGTDGWLAEPGDVEGLAAILIPALGDRDRLRAMGLKARRKALERFAWDRTAAAMLERIEADRSG